MNIFDIMYPDKSWWFKFKMLISFLFLIILIARSIHRLEQKSKKSETDKK